MIRDEKKNPINTWLGGTGRQKIIQLLHIMKKFQMIIYIKQARVCPNQLGAEILLNNINRIEIENRTIHRIN